MALEVTPEAAALLRRSLELAGMDPGRAGVRLRLATALGGGGQVQVEFAEAASEGEEVLERHGVRLFVDPGVNAALPEAVVTVEPQHDRVVVRPRRAT